MRWPVHYFHGWVGWGGEVKTKAYLSQVRLKLRLSLAISEKRNFFEFVVSKFHMFQIQSTQPDALAITLTPRRSHLTLCVTWQVECTCTGDHIRAWCRELQNFAHATCLTNEIVSACTFNLPGGQTQGKM